MSQAMHLVANNVYGCRVPEGRCVLCPGVSGKTAYPCSSLVYHRIHSHVKILGLKCVSFVCEASRNPDFSRQNKHRFSRNRKWDNERIDTFENSEEDMLSLKNGALMSLTSAPKFRTTAAPGPREKEIVELFRKVQVRLRERAATKEEKKVEASQGQGKENGTVDSLLKLLRKHSVEQIKGSSEGGRGKYFSKDQLQHISQYNGGQSTEVSDLDNAPEEEFQEANTSSITRPPSNFQQKSSVPRLKYQPLSYNENDKNSISLWIRKNDQDQDPVLKPDSEQQLDPKDDFSSPDVGIAELSEGDLHDSDSELPYNDEHEEHLVVQHEDLSALKLSELRAVAKSRSLKRFSKMKKGELMELLAGS